MIYIYIYIGLSTFPVIVTTRIISCLAGDSYKPSFATSTGKGDNPKYIYIYIYLELVSPLFWGSFEPSKRRPFLHSKQGSFGYIYIYTWNPKQPFINGCFNWMIPNLYIGNGCFTKHPFFNGWPWGSRYIYTHNLDPSPFPPGFTSD